MEVTEGGPLPGERGQGSRAPGEPPAMMPKKSRQRRRRWLMVAFVLVLVSLGTWWNWPRGDARFVGKWKESERSHITMELTSSGWMNVRDAYSTLPPNSVRWWTDGEWLVTTRAPVEGIDHWKLIFSYFSARVLGTPAPAAFRRYGIVEISNSSLRLRGHVDPQSIKAYVKVD